MISVLLSAIPALAITLSVIRNVVFFRRLGGNYYTLLSVQDHLLTALAYVPGTLITFMFAAVVHTTIGELIERNSTRIEQIAARKSTAMEYFILSALLLAVIVILAKYKYLDYLSIYAQIGYALITSMFCTGIAFMLFSLYKQIIKISYLMLILGLSFGTVTVTAINAAKEARNLKDSDYSEYVDAVILKSESKLNYFSNISRQRVYVVRYIDKGVIVALMGGYLSFIPNDQILSVRHQMENDFSERLK